MNNHIKIKTLLDSPIGGAIDQSLSMTPGVNIVWGAIKNSIESTKEIRILRGLEFFEIISEPNFINAITQSEQTLDGLALCFESYIKERNQEKRKIIKNIFLGFTKLSEEEEKEKFQLERLLDITNKITFDEIKYLKHFYNDLIPLQDKYIDYHINDSGYYRNDEIIDVPITKFINFDNNDIHGYGKGFSYLEKNIFNKYYNNLDLTHYLSTMNGLVSLSLLFPVSKGVTFDSSNSPITNDYEFTNTGHQFIKYITK